MSQDVIVSQEDVSAAYDHFIAMFFPKWKRRCFRSCCLLRISAIESE